MVQVEPTLDLRIATQVHRELVATEVDPQGPVIWQQTVLLVLGAVALDEVPQGKGPNMSSGA